MIGPGCNGVIMVPREFDSAEFEEGWRFELVNDVLVVSPMPSEIEAGPNEKLMHLLLSYQEHHPQGSFLDASLPERIIKTGRNRRRPDRCMWTGYGRFPRKTDRPTVIAEFVPSGKRNRERDYVAKRKEYMNFKVKEYWIFDRFDRCLVVFTRQGGKTRRRVVKEHEIYTTPLMPGFELPVAKLLELADKWASQKKQTDESIPELWE